MRTIGQILKTAREAKGLIKQEVSRKTKIKIEFISAIEKEQWNKLPEYPVLQGFVRNIAEATDLNPANTLAILRRDYPPKKINPNPKPDVKQKFAWSPKLTFLIGSVTVVLIGFIFIIAQYINFIKPPTLEITLPKEGEVVKESRVTVIGRTNPEAVVRVNNQPVLLDNQGGFKTEIEISENTHEVEIKSTLRSGKETVVKRTIKPEINN